MGFFGGGGGGTVDWTAPGTIGSVTPNTGAFTTLSATPPANTSAISSTGFSLTGSSAQTLFSLSGTWNTTGTPTAILLNITNTASNAASRLLDLQVGGATRFYIGCVDSNTSPRLAINRADGNTEGFYITTSTSSLRGAWIVGSSGLFVGASAVNNPDGGTVITANSVAVRSDTGEIGFGSGTNPSSGRDAIFRRDAAGSIAQRNGTNSQSFRLYRTFTDASNYERISLIATRTTRFAIAAENAGTGAARSLEISFYTSASDPTSTDITDGCFSVWKNSGTGTIKLWANDGGTMKSVALA